MYIIYITIILKGVFAVNIKKLLNIHPLLRITFSLAKVNTQDYIKYFLHYYIKCIRKNIKIKK